MKKFLVLLSLLLMNSAIAADMRFVQVSDARFSKENEVNTLATAIKDINKLKDVEFVVFTGDNIAKPQKDNLIGFLDEAKKLNCPFYIVLGDHDVNKHKEMSKKEYIKIIKKHVRKYKPEEANYTFEKNGVVFMVVDGSKDVIPGTNGFYKEDTLNWLKTQLDLQPRKNIIILQHFPLIPPNGNENYYTFKPENYLKLLAAHKNVKAVISGHFGVNKEEKVKGIMHISTAPLPEYRIIDIMDYDTPNPTIWAELKHL